MDLTFYFSYDEFLENYNADYDAWKKNQIDNNEFGAEKETSEDVYLYWLYEGWIKSGYKDFQKDSTYPVYDASIGAHSVKLDMSLGNLISIIMGNIIENFKKKYNIKSINETEEMLYDFEGDLNQFISDRENRFRFSKEVDVINKFIYIEKDIIPMRPIEDEDGEIVANENGFADMERGRFKEGKIAFDHIKFEMFLEEIEKISLFISERYNELIGNDKENISNTITDINTIDSIEIKNVKKIGLLIRSGILDYLKEKNPKITNNQIAGFIELITKEPLKQTSVNPHLSKNNVKYAIQNNQDKSELDLILLNFGISPQSE